MKFEELERQTQLALDAIYGFLGVGARPRERSPKLNEADDYSWLEPETRAALIDYFRPHIERLYAPTRIDFGWPP